MINYITLKYIATRYPSTADGASSHVKSTVYSVVFEAAKFSTVLQGVGSTGGPQVIPASQPGLVTTNLESKLNTKEPSAAIEVN